MGGVRSGEWGGVQGGQDGCERRIEVFMKIQKKKGGARSGRGGGDGLGGQVGCERRIEVFVKIQNNNFFWGGRGRVGGWGVGRVRGESGWMLTKN